MIIGSGAHGRIVAETITLLGEWEIAGFGDDDPKKANRTIGRWRVHQNWREIEVTSYIVAIGINEARQRIFEELRQAQKELPTIVHPWAYVSPEARLAVGTVVLAGAVISLGATVGQNVIINVGAVVDHDAIVMDHAHVGQNATVGSFGKVEPLEHILPGTVRLRAR